jgi:hypothetical protein
VIDEYSSVEPFDAGEPSEPDLTKLDDHLGSFAGLFEGFDLDALRDEWERPG